MRPAVIAAAHEISPNRCNRRQGTGCPVRLCDVRRIILRPYKNKVIVHDFRPMRAVAALDKSLFRLARMDEDRINVPRLAQLDCLPCADDK